MRTDLVTDQHTATLDRQGATVSPCRTSTTGAPGPNDLLPCGTDSARRRHLARNERCRRCGLDDGVLPVAVRRAE